ncbi:MAG: dual specificity protein phosphatase family protein [Gemmatimonadetes bacterium]|nr:dual specificity protein phosphatase family protein [Gemmatimonadota bacterium]
MKYATLFLALGLSMGYAATTGGGLRWLLVWPATSFAGVGIAYAGVGAGLFGKQPDGSLRLVSVAVLLPYLLLAWFVWHIARVLKREEPFDSLIPGVFIGRRLLAHEYPEEIRSVVDLTCEFAEPLQVRACRPYRAFPILDASTPSTESLLDVVRHIAESGQGVFIHCAEGHGRTGLVAAALLLSLGHADTPERAMAMVQQRRPQALLNTVQQRAVESYARAMNARR